jgi:hypothetical protein
MTDFSQRVNVPRAKRALVPASVERVRKLHRHLVNVLLASRTIDEEPTTASVTYPEMEGFASRVAAAACSLCQGSCCTNGGDDAFLGESTMTRVRGANPELELVEIANLYVSQVPRESMEGSCIFHGKKGCALHRTLRSDICNDHYCNGLHEFLRSGDYGLPVVIVAGEGDGTRASPLLMP